MQGDKIVNIQFTIIKEITNSNKQTLNTQQLSSININS